MAKAASKAKPAVRLDAQQRELVESQCRKAGGRLTPARLEAYAILRAADQPLSAYALVALLEAHQARKIAPLTVYRHLDFLIKVGLVHRLESRQAYVCCDHPEHQHESQYLLCSNCGRVDELDSKQLSDLLNRITSRRGFQVENAVVEVSGLCVDCVETGA